MNFIGRVIAAIQTAAKLGNRFSVITVAGLQDLIRQPIGVITLNPLPICIQHHLVDISYGLDESDPLKILRLNGLHWIPVTCDFDIVGFFNPINQGVIKECQRARLDHRFM